MMKTFRYCQASKGMLLTTAAAAPNMYPLLVGQIGEEIATQLRDVLRES